jgi:phospholipid/cholesterol/gamma-HCH transport system substrate-binding protein
MNHKSALQRIHPLWWTAALVVIVVGFITLSMALFGGS